jgi:hypothetical protein
MPWGVLRFIRLWPLAEATAASRGVCLLTVHPPLERRCRSSISATTCRMSAICAIGVSYRSKFFRGGRKSSRQFMTYTGSRSPAIDAKSAGWVYWQKFPTA